MFNGFLNWALSVYCPKTFGVPFASFSSCVSAVEQCMQRYRRPIPACLGDCGFGPSTAEHIFWRCVGRATASASAADSRQQTLALSEGWFALMGYCGTVPGSSCVGRSGVRIGLFAIAAAAQLGQLAFLAYKLPFIENRHVSALVTELIFRLMIISDATLRYRAIA